MSEHLELEAISAYLDAELDAENEAAVREHLSACLECRQVLDELQSLDRLAHAAPEPAPKEVGTDVATRVRARLLAERSSTRTLQGSWLAAAAALAAVLVLPWVLLDRSREAERGPAPAAAVTAPAPPPPIADGPPATAAPGFAPPPAPAKERKKVGNAPAPSEAAAEAKPAEALRRERASGAGADTMAADEGVEAEMAPAAAPPPPPPPAAAPAETLAKDKDARSDAARKSGSFAAGAAESGRRNALDDDEFNELSSRQVSTAREARRWRESWRAYARRFPSSAHLSQARLALVAAGALAYRLEGRPEDLARLRLDVEEVRRVATAADGAAAQRMLEEAEREAETQRSP